MIGGYFNLRIKQSDEPAVVETKFPWAPISIGGTPDQIAESFEQFRLAGLEYAICLLESESVDDYLRQVHVFAAQIAPSMTRSSCKSRHRSVTSRKNAERPFQFQFLPPALPHLARLLDNPKHR